MAYGSRVHHHQLILSGAYLKYFDIISVTFVCIVFKVVMITCKEKQTTSLILDKNGVHCFNTETTTTTTNNYIIYYLKLYVNAEHQSNVSWEEALDFNNLEVHVMKIMATVICHINKSEKTHETVDSSDNTRGHYLHRRTEEVLVFLFQFCPTISVSQ